MESKHAHDIIVVGASAGGVDAIGRLVASLPADINAAVFVVLHIPAYGTSALPEILARKGRLAAIHPKDFEAIRNGTVYVAPPDHHLIVERGHVRLSRGPKENRNRPSIDVLFRSAAEAYGPRVAGVVLSGTLDDGTAGLVAIHEAGGITMAQDPSEAMYPAMPLSAIRHDHVVASLPITGIALKLLSMARAYTDDDVAEDGDADAIADEVAAAQFGAPSPEEMSLGTPSTYTCPECHGTLWEIEKSELLRFRCRVGHAYTAENLIVGQGGALETALWTALRSLEETAALNRRMANRAAERLLPSLRERYAKDAGRAEGHAETIRRVLIFDDSEGSVDADTHSIGQRPHTE